MQHTASRTIRRYIYPIIIVIVAIGLFYLNEQREAAKQREIRILLLDLGDAARAGDLAADRIPAVDPLLAPSLVKAFRDACSNDGTMTVEVRKGEPPHRPHGPASHYAILRIAGIDRLGLRLATPDDRIVILGYWRPDAHAAPEPNRDDGRGPS
jgi:hypothetical protein